MKEFIKGNERDVIESGKVNNFFTIKVNLDRNFSYKALLKGLHRLENIIPQMFMVYDKNKNEWINAQIHPIDMIIKVNSLSNLDFNDYNDYLMVRFFIDGNAMQIVVNHVMIDKYGMFELLELLFSYMENKHSFENVKQDRITRLQDIFKITNNYSDNDKLAPLQLDLTSKGDTKFVESLFISNSDYQHLIDYAKVNELSLDIIVKGLIIKGLHSITQENSFSFKQECDLRDYIYNENNRNFIFSNLYAYQDVNVYDASSELSLIFNNLVEVQQLIDNDIYNYIDDVIKTENKLSRVPNLLASLYARILSTKKDNVLISSFDIRKYEYLDKLDCIMLGAFKHLPKLNFNITINSHQISIITLYYDQMYNQYIEKIYDIVQLELKNLILNKK